MRKSTLQSYFVDGLKTVYIVKKNQSKYVEYNYLFDENMFISYKYYFKYNFILYIILFVSYFVLIIDSTSCKN